MPDREKVIEELEDSRRLIAPQINAKYHRNRLELMIKGIEDALDLLKERESTLNRLRSTMEDMVRGNASEEVSYLLRLMDKWEKGAKVKNE